MTRQTTALLTVGPRTLAPWNDRVWRVAGTAQLVEGSAPYWLVTPTQPAEHEVTTETILVEVPHADAVVWSVLMVVAAWFGGSEVEAVLTEGQNLTVDAVTGAREVAPYWELADTTVTTLASKLSAQVRLGLTLMDDLSLVDDDVVEGLRALGFDVDVFVLGSVATAGQVR